MDDKIVAKTTTVAAVIVLLAGSGFPAAAADWYGLGWKFRLEIAIDTNKVVGTLSSFPVLVARTNAPSGLWANAQPEGVDILFTLSDGTTKLSHEIESYDPASSQLWAWVKLPTLSSASASDTNLYMYYGGGSTDQQDVTNVWDANYVGVWHLKENPTNVAPQIKDSTSHTNHGTCQASMTNDDQVAGQVNGSLNFKGGAGGDQVDCPHDASFDFGTGDFTIEAWARNPVAEYYTPCIISKKTGVGAATVGWLLKLYGWAAWDVYTKVSDGSFEFAMRSGSVFNNSNWHHVTFVIDRDSEANTKVWIDGEDDTTVTTDPITNLTAAIDNNIVFRLADAGAGGRDFEGRLDEVRVSNMARTVGWIKTSYNNQSEPAGFVAFGSVEEAPRGTIVLVE